jgi:hypothetical protein
MTTEQSQALLRLASRAHCILQLTQLAKQQGSDAALLDSWTGSLICDLDDALHAAGHPDFT